MPKVSILCNPAEYNVKIIDALDGKIGGVGLWDVNDYYSPGYGYKNTK